MFIFARCLATPGKYELDIIQVTTVLIIRKKMENKGTEKIGLVTPTPGPSRVLNMYQVKQVLVCHDAGF